MRQQSLLTIHTGKARNGKSIITKLPHSLIGQFDKGHFSATATFWAGANLPG